LRHLKEKGTILSNFINAIKLGHFCAN